MILKDLIPLILLTSSVHMVIVLWECEKACAFKTIIMVVWP